MKTVLEEVQLEVKREEEKRNELQLQYTRDKWSWELEKAELKCRIGQVTPAIICSSLYLKRNHSIIWHFSNRLYCSYSVLSVYFLKLCACLHAYSPVWGIVGLPPT